MLQSLSDLILSLFGPVRTLALDVPLKPLNMLVVAGLQSYRYTCTVNAEKAGRTALTCRVPVGRYLSLREGIRFATAVLLLTSQGNPSCLSHQRPEGKAKLKHGAGVDVRTGMGHALDSYSVLQHLHGNLDVTSAELLLLPQQLQLGILQHQILQSDECGKPRSH